MEINKYIIRNCPAIYGIDDGFLCSYRENEEDEKYCYDCTDCKLKQIVELCKENLNSLETYVDIRSLECTTLQNILKLLDIQEITDEREQ